MLSLLGKMNLWKRGQNHTKMKLLIYILIGNSSPSIFLGIEQMTVGRKDDQIKLGKSWVGKTGEGRRC